MKKSFALAAAAMLLAAPVAAQSVPLNTVSGGEGKEQVTGQAAVGLAGLGAAGTAAAVVVAATVVLVAVAAEESSTTTN